MRKRNGIVWMLVLLMVLALFPGVSFAEPPVGPCSGRDAVRNGGNHFWNQTGHVDPTCTEAGYTTYQCVYCGQTYTDNIPALGHDWHTTKKVDPTCTEQGYSKQVCQRDSSHTRTVNKDPLGHDWGDWHVVLEPTLTTEGAEERQCQRCGLTERRPIPPLGQKEQYSLALVMVQTAPSGDTFPYEDLMDEIGGGIVLVYDVTLINTGTEPLNVLDYSAGPGLEYATLGSAVTLYPGESAGLTLPRPMYPEDMIPGSASETLFGATVYDFYFFGDSFDGEDHVCQSNTVSFEYKIKSPAGFDEWAPPSESAVMVEKNELSASADPNGYQLGETIFYNLFVGNIGAQPLQGVTLFDCLNGGAEEALMTSDLEPGEGWPYVYEHTVTPEDVNQGFVANYAIARWTDPDSGEAMEEKSETVTVPVINKAGLVLYKYVEGGPANGQYYVPGEAIHFKVTVLNNFATTQKAIMVEDPLMGQIQTCPDMAPGESVTLDFNYEVTEYDAILGYVENYAFTIEIDAVSNTVRVDAGFDGPFGVITALEVTKVETSIPQNPQGYVEGETITYEITVKNTGETVIVEGTVHDSLKEGTGEIGAFENLYPETSRTYTFSYVVTEEDVHSPSRTVINQAAVWYDHGGHDALQTSNEVESPVWGEDPYGFEDDDEPPLHGVDCCTRTLTGKGAGTDAFTVHFCGAHVKLQAELESQLAYAATEEQQLSALRSARSAWQSAMDTMYEDARAKANSATAAALLEQQLGWKEYVTSYEALLTKLYPNAPLTVARELMEETRDQCVDLCYELHKAPEKRPDSILGKHEALQGADANAVCARNWGALGGAEMSCQETFCQDHANVDAKIVVLANAAVNKDAQAAAFMRGQRMWQSLMDNRTNARYKAADKDTRALIARNRMAFDKYLNARKALLTVLYPGQPDVVAEILARAFQDKELDLCMLWKQ